MSNLLSLAGIDPPEPAERARIRLGALARELRDDLDRVSDPRTRALFATTADLLVALEEAFADAGARSEPPLRR